MNVEMKSSLRLCALGWLLFALTPLVGQRPITLDDCFTYFKFYPESGPDLRFMADGRHYLSIEDGQEIVQFDLLTQKPDSVLVRKQTGLKIDAFETTPDERVFLLRSQSKAVYRHSVLARYHVWDRRTQRLTPVSVSGKAQFAALSPAGTHVAIVEGNDIIIKHLADGFEERVTVDGRQNHIINGLPDWVYEEEFSPSDGDGMVALVWNPDGQRLAFLKFDESAVEQMPLTWYEDGMYPRRSQFKFPKVGTPNSTVSLHIYDLNNRMLAPCADVKTNPDDYIVRLNWASKFNLVATVLNRAQDSLRLMLLTPEGIRSNLAFGVEQVLQEVDSAYVDIHDNLRFLENGQQFIWASERSGYNHLYLYDFIKGNLIRPLTTGNHDVTALYMVDEKKGKFYYQAATPTPLDRQIWEGSLDGRAPRLLTPTSGTHEANFAPTADFFTLNRSDVNTPLVATLNDRSGKSLHTFIDNTDLIQLRKDYGFVEKTFVKIPVPIGNGQTEYLNASILRPVQHPDSAAKRYPVLFDVYGGPGSQTVQNQYDGYTGNWHQYLVQKGYIIVSVDNRGTGARGRAFKKCTQLQLGRYETEDQISAARYLGTQPYVDPARIGIWGWSFGGYLSTSCILKGNDVFKMGMAVAPVTNWRWYDSAYTERFMRTTESNPQGYKDNSPVNFAHLLRGDNYLLCHGIADDNVHWQQSTEMINALVKSGKQFDMAAYPNRNHGIYGANATRHLFTKLTNFVLEHL
jgi:dipeptidyl-peptidase 4